MGTYDDAVQLASELGAGDYDVLMIADGSGTLANKPCGWCCFLFETDKKQYRSLFGGTNSGTNNYAELSPFLHGLFVYFAAFPKLEDFQEFINARGKPLKVFCISDSEITVRCGNKVYQRKSNYMLWSQIEAYENLGVKFKWKHVPRNSNQFNNFADKMSRSVRHALEAVTMEKP